MTRCTATRPTPGLLWRNTPTRQGCALDAGHDGEHEWSMHPGYRYTLRQAEAAKQAERDALIAQGRREAIAEVVGWLGEQMESLAKSDMSDAREVEDQTLVLGVMNDIRLHLEKFK